MFNLWSFNYPGPKFSAKLKEIVPPVHFAILSLKEPNFKKIIKYGKTNLLIFSKLFCLVSFLKVEKTQTVFEIEN